MEEDTLKKLESLAASLEAIEKLSTPVYPALQACNRTQDFLEYVGPKLKKALLKKQRNTLGLVCISRRYLEGDEKRVMDFVADELKELDDQFPVVSSLDIGNIELVVVGHVDAGPPQVIDEMAHRVGRKSFLFYVLVHVDPKDVQEAVDMFGHGESEVGRRLYYPQYEVEDAL